MNISNNNNNGIERKAWSRIHKQIAKKRGWIPKGKEAKILIKQDKNDEIKIKQGKNGKIKITQKGYYGKTLIVLLVVAIICFLIVLFEWGPFYLSRDYLAKERRLEAKTKAAETKLKKDAEDAAKKKEEEKIKEAHKIR